ncbi:phosphate-starvation-inducible protein PsiE [Paraburkholderia sp. BCC1884]|uniref:phosphate-starvation-inducible protein PsiE n=1 Tax=Paraburkholderia sp. BCC1884 TaxID=2562668 RepID=UPI001183855F|nr:phosphate-starvation-inducible PsiE family protein [Paraburkholderia sp. BCC1884]
MEISPDALNIVRARFNRYLLFAEFLGLVATALAAVVAMGQEIRNMVLSGTVTLTDLLLMFLYLEVLAMVGQYFKSGQLPVRFPLYIAMVALARELILGNGTATGSHMLETAGAILVLALGVLVIRIGQVKFPTQDDGKFEK